MKGVAKLKDEARKYEQREEWEKAIDAYLQVLKSAEGGDQEVDLPLYNRVGDLLVRLGKSADAVTYYEQAADQYAEAGLYNNAIALCNKALRYVPNRLELIRKLGQFSAAQGFLTDARRWYLEYAERQLKAGQLDDAFKALEDFATVHEDAEIRELLGRQLKAHHRIDHAVAALKRAHALRSHAGQLEDAERLRAEILTLRPDAFEAGDDFEPPMIAPRAPEKKRTRQDDIEIWRPPPETPPAAGLELETAAGAAFGGAPEEAGTIELPAFEAEESPEQTSSFEIGEIGLESSSIDMDAIDTADQQPLVDVGGLGLEEPLGAEDALAFEIETADLSSGLDLESAATTEEIDVEPLPFLTLEEAEAAEEGMELPLLDTLDEPVDSLELIDAETVDLTFDAVESPADELITEPTWEDSLEEVESVEATPVDEFMLEDETPSAELDLESVDETTVDEPVGEIELEEPAFEQPLAANAAVEETVSFTEPEPETWTLEPEISEPVAAPTLEPWQELQQGEDLAASGDRGGAILHFDDLQSRFAAAGLKREAWQACSALLRLDPVNRRMMQLRIDYATNLNDQALLRDSYLDLARYLAAQGESAQARTTFRRVLEIDPNNPEARKAVHGPAPVAASGYVDLMSYIGEKDDEEASTRFVVAEKAPTGDEERDFADMLSQFKQKVAEHVSVGEASAHYDLGLAFKEMGLIDEAIAEFQTALKGGEERLKVYEELGQCFLLKQQYNVAVTVLTRALQMPVTDESALVGVYYALGRSHEELGQREEARRAYERVVGLDINFQDATRRLASL